MAISQVSGLALSYVRPPHTANQGQGASGPTSEKASRIATNDKVAEPVSSSEMEKALSTLNRLVAPAARAIQFSIDDASGRTVVKVIDTETHQVLRQVPAEEALAISRVLDKLKGLLIHQKA
jgi:flagellar protein FlaG